MIRFRQCMGASLGLMLIGLLCVGSARAQSEQAKRPGNARLLSAEGHSELAKFAIEQIGRGVSGTRLGRLVQNKAKQIRERRGGRAERETESRTDRGRRRSVAGPGTGREATGESREGQGRGRGEGQRASRTDRGRRRSVAGPDTGREATGESREGQGRGRGPGTALQHGLSEKDLSLLGRQVNEMLASGLRGQALSASIKRAVERQKRNVQRGRQPDGSASGDRAVRQAGKGGGPVISPAAGRGKPEGKGRPGGAAGRGAKGRGPGR